MYKGKTKIGIAGLLVAFMVVMLCSGCGQQAKQEAAPQDVGQAYEAFIQDQKAAEGTGEIYAAITTASEDGSPVLLIAGDACEFEGENQAVEAGVYSWADGQVVKICDLASGGTAYPIGIVEEKYLVAGSHHTLERCLVSGNAATVELVEGIAMEEGNCTMTTYTVANDEISGAEEKEISAEEGEDFANAIYEAWEPVVFTKY